MAEEKGFCQCGCGQKTKISPKTCTSKGWIRGIPRRFIHGHHIGHGENHPRWKNGRFKFNSRKKEYWMILCPGHPRATPRYVFEHILIVERAMGKYLPEGAVVHHVDEDGLNNRNDNLVACQDEGYHMLLHARMRAQKRREANV